ncbi:DoxX family protein [Mesorhizobium sp. B2-6-2]|uniref:DoxX family protein n=1 Tax=Mesorhizobium sp. B2-6-2 TaxID=2589915 RepID=UPI00112AD8B2|nr:DoxX family protein [Mesorhizobium sp. B2-6-2]TPJ73146.1 DoxX family protein [Mesorhizobium sp. B2-6-2]
MPVQSIQALGALLIGGVFVFAGIEHFLKFGAMRDYLAAQKFPAPALMLAVGSMVEAVAGFLLAVGITRPFAAGALATFTLATNVMLLRFWAVEEPERQVLRNAFLVNIAVIGGLLLAGTLYVAWGFRPGRLT